MVREERVRKNSEWGKGSGRENEREENGGGGRE